MNHTRILTILVMSLLLSSSFAFAQDPPADLTALKFALADMQAQMVKQDKVLRERDETIARLQASSVTSGVRDAIIERLTEERDQALERVTELESELTAAKAQIAALEEKVDDFGRRLERLESAGSMAAASAPTTTLAGYQPRSYIDPSVRRNTVSLDVRPSRPAPYTNPALTWENCINCVRRQNLNDSAIEVLVPGAAWIDTRHGKPISTSGSVIVPARSTIYFQRPKGASSIQARCLGVGTDGVEPGEWFPANVDSVSFNPNLCGS